MESLCNHPQSNWRLRMILVTSLVHDLGFLLPPTTITTIPSPPPQHHADTICSLDMLRRFPTEIIQKICDELGGDLEAFITLRIAYKGSAHQSSLFPAHPPHTHTFPLRSKDLLRTAIPILGAWLNNIRQLDLSGNKHSPHIFFDLLSLFAGLESLVLRNFSFEVERNHTFVLWPQKRYRLPPTLKQLCLIQSNSMLTSLEHHLKRGGSALRDVYIQAVFSFDQPGISSLLESIQNLQGVHTLTLDALYDESDDHIGKSSRLGYSCMARSSYVVSQTLICPSIFSCPKRSPEYPDSGTFASI